MIPFPIIIIFFVHSSFANFEDSYPETSENNVFPEEYLDQDADDGDNDLEKRDNHFMRFGKKNDGYKEEYEDVEIPAKRSWNLKRSGNHHVRFGRAGSNSFLRFGRDMNKGRREKSLFGNLDRSYGYFDDKFRTKRSLSENQPDSDHNKRKDHFMRFGKSPSFMRYGRAREEESTGLFDRSYIDKDSVFGTTSSSHPGGKIAGKKAKTAKAISGFGITDDLRV